MSTIAKLAIVVGILAVALGGALVVRDVVASDDDPVVIVHWANGHPMTDPLLPAMADEFNDEEHETSSGRPIHVEVVRCDSANQADDLVARIQQVSNSANGCEVDDAPAPSPTIVTPQSTDWLLDVNRRTGQQVVDMEATVNIAETWLGIVTYEEMARCLGWPDRAIGYADILELAADPDGWGSRDCASTTWKKTPQLAFTNPRKSTSGRNVLVSLFSIAAGKSPGDLTMADLERSEVIERVQEINSLANHYQPTSTSLNTRIAAGPTEGHFFLLPEDNLVNLRRGEATAIGRDGTAQKLEPQPDLVMIYPKEGSVLNANPAGVVRAPWVTPDHVDGAQQWIDFLREDDRQHTFMESGFRSSTGLEADAEQFQQWGLNPAEPKVQIEPGDLEPDVLERIIDLWGSVKNPAVVTFVVDVSGSMREGDKLAAVKQGMTELIGEMADANNPSRDSQVGLLTFDSSVLEVVPPASIADSKWDIQDVVDRAEPGGGTALYTAVSRAITISDAAEAPDDATRAVVVLSDGEATEGLCLSEVLEVWSSSEVFVPDYCGMDGEAPVDENGNRVATSDLQGRALAQTPQHDVQVFFVGFGDADVNIGRLLADATGAEFQGSTEADLANVIEDLSGYF